MNGVLIHVESMKDIRALSNQVSFSWASDAMSRSDP